MTVFTRSVPIMSLLKSIKTPPTGVLGGHRVVPNRFYTHCKKYAPICQTTSSLMYNIYSALFSHCKYVKIDQKSESTTTKFIQWVTHTLEALSHTTTQLWATTLLFCLRAPAQRRLMLLHVKSDVSFGAPKTYSVAMSCRQSKKMLFCAASTPISCTQ